ncbi:hypothetical protein HX787_07945 [Pseudomonas tolaasii]|uniref:Uncharacterized protein n=1 Tax=Pseudomonas tolaasii TaxID=29442 RepID=A0A7Y8ANP9_PSETO|nr:hypothetical protein [Pseudomonas tolaasii]NWC20378.1 hypothetical protein [Pseudomonas tolaasii]NWD35785.1 hypothetical protein [Pseudomonas tolaasii]
MSKSAELKKQLNEAREYVVKLSTPQHFADRKPGYIHTLNVDTQIGFQASPSAQNYWKHKEFDAALAKVVRDQFSILAEAALAEMQSAYTEARISDKEGLLAALAEIEALEGDAA